MPLAQQYQDILDGLDVPSLLHGPAIQFERISYFTLTQKVDGSEHFQGDLFEGVVKVQTAKKWYEKAYPVGKIISVYDIVNPTIDTYISMSLFYRQARRVATLSWLSCLFLDLDIYRVSKFDGASTRKVLETISKICDDSACPRPSIITYSGRGYQCKWIFDKSLTYKALPRWQACQRQLLEYFKVLGADFACKDASRVLRLERTTNSKSGDTARIVYIEPQLDLFGSAVKLYSFEELTAQILPFRRDELSDRNKQRTKDKIIPFGFNFKTLAWHRFADLRRLADLRGGFTAGMRELAVFWAANFFGQAGLIDGAGIWAEIQTIAQVMGGSDWQKRELNRMSDFTTLMRRADLAKAGSFILFDGKLRSPFYLARNSTLIDIFQITNEEMQQLSTILSEDEIRRRKDQRKIERRSTGMDRETYLKNSYTHSKPWEYFGVSRRTWERRGKPMPHNKEQKGP